MNSFYFFKGFIHKTTVNVEEEMINTLSEQINQEIDEEIIRTVTRRINGGEDNLRYLNHWISLGNNRA